MSEILEFYQRDALKHRSNSAWLAQLQQKGTEDLARFGFPTRHHEAWKYTTVDGFLKSRFSRKTATDIEEIQAIAPVPLANQVHFLNGQLLQSHLNLPKATLVLPLSVAISEYADLIKPYLDKILHSSHAFQALNSAMLQEGLFIFIPKGIEISEPILIQYHQNRASEAVYMRQVIVAEDAAMVSVIEDFQGSADCTYHTNTITEIYVGQQASVQHYKIQREGNQAFHTGHIAVEQSQSSMFKSHSLSLGGKWVRSDMDIRLLAPQANCVLNGIYAPARGQHIDHHTSIHHDVPDCTSAQDYKGILAGGSRAVFNGKVVVAKDAQQTKASQQNKNLLLSTQAEIDTLPQLEIFADDVVCSHGATVGQLDEEALFYLATRGIAREEAYRYLIQAFTIENFRLIEPLALSEWMEQLLTQHIG